MPESRIDPPEPPRKPVTLSEILMTTPVEEIPELLEKSHIGLQVVHNEGGGLSYFVRPIVAPKEDHGLDNSGAQKSGG
jgi:hypothetical protein